jgi:SnoaL-like domain
MNFKMLSPLLGIMYMACSTAGAQGAPSPAVVFDRYVAAVHAADMTAVRALISADVERSDFAGCRPEMDNPSCLAHYIETTVVKPGARITELSRRVEGDTVTAELEVRSPLYARAGAERIVGRDIVRVRDGRIVSFRFVPDFSDQPTAIFFGTLGIGPRARGN